MSKIKLGTPPKEFKKDVTIPLLEGDSEDVTFTFKFRTRQQYGELVDAMNEKSSKPPKGNKPLTTKEGFEIGAQLAIDYIMDIASGWSLPEEFNKDNIRLFVDNIPGASMAVTEAYRLAIVEGRIKN